MVCIAGWCRLRIFVILWYIRYNNHHCYIGRIIKENPDNPKIGLQKLREKIQSMTHSGELDLLNNKTNQEIAKLALNLHIVFGEIKDFCEPGSIPRKHTCSEKNIYFLISMRYFNLLQSSIYIIVYTIFFFFFLFFPQ